MAALARKGKFPKVIAAIDEMVVGLKKEQQEEVEHKDFCNDKFHELEMTTMKKTEEQSGLEAKIADTTNHLEADKEKIVQINAEIADTTVAIQSANADRVKESQDFQTVVADQRAVQQVMLLALDKLEKFYGKSFLQTAPAKSEANATTDHMLMRFPSRALVTTTTFSTGDSPNTEASSTGWSSHHTFWWKPTGHHDCY